MFVRVLYEEWWRNTYSTLTRQSLRIRQLEGRDERKGWPCDDSFNGLWVVVTVRLQVSGHNIIINAGLGRNLLLRHLACKGKSSSNSLPIQTISRRVFDAWAFLVVHGDNVMLYTTATFRKLPLSWRPKRRYGVTTYHPVQWMHWGCLPSAWIHEWIPQLGRWHLCENSLEMRHR